MVRIVASLVCALTLSALTFNRLSAGTARAVESGICSGTWETTSQSTTSCSAGGITKREIWSIRWSDGTASYAQNMGEGSCCSTF